MGGRKNYERPRRDNIPPPLTIARFITAMTYRAADLYIVDREWIQIARKFGYRERTIAHGVDRIIDDGNIAGLEFGLTARIREQCREGQIVRTFQRMLGVVDILFALGGWEFALVGLVV